MPACTITAMRTRVDSIYWSVVSVALTAFGVWHVGADLATETLLGAAGGAATLACWRRTEHLAQWLAGGVAAVSGALLTLVFEAAMNGASDDPSTAPLVFSFAGAAAVSGTLHNRIARTQAAREQELDRALAALPTSASLDELEQRLSAAMEESRTRPGSWRAWWRTRPGGR